MTHPADSQDRDLRRRLEALRIDAPDDGFRATLHRRLVEAGTPAAPSAWARLAEALRAPGLRWPALGAAAGLAAALLVAAPALRAPAGAPAGGTVLPSTRVAVVRLNLAADAPVDAAHIRVSLPPGLAFWADGQALASRELSWSQPLEPGDNEIPIAVRGQQPGRYRIGVAADVGGQRIQEEILLEVTGG